MIISQHWLIPVVNFVLLIENMVTSFILTNSISDNQDSNDNRLHTREHHHHSLRHAHRQLDHKEQGEKALGAVSFTLTSNTSFNNRNFSSNRTKSALSQINHAGNPSTSNILSSYFVEQSWRSSDAFESQREQFERDCVQNMRSEEPEHGAWQCRVKAQRRKVTTLANNILNKPETTDKPDLSVFTLKQHTPRLLEIQHKPLYCLCQYEYDCGVENEKFYFGSSYMNKLRAQNEKIGVRRGADYQCELALNRQHSVVNAAVNQNMKASTSGWKCQIKRSLEKAMSSHITGENDMNLDDEYHCDCSRQKKCKRQRLVDFY